MFFHHLHKKIFSLLLILSLTIPANAAVSVSDGSAFVSKAEFSTDITNLSNRMAQLENSLDAKIDSLVSSYLSRNGIWNGEAQELLYNANNKMDVIYADTYTTAGATSTSLYGMTLYSSSNGKYYNNALCRNKYKLVNNVSKSGLAFIRVYFEGYVNRGYYSFSLMPIPFSAITIQGLNSALSNSQYSSFRSNMNSSMQKESYNPNTNGGSVNLYLKSGGWGQESLSISHLFYFSQDDSINLNDDLTPLNVDAFATTKIDGAWGVPEISTGSPLDTTYLRSMSKSFGSAAAQSFVVFGFVQKDLPIYFYSTYKMVASTTPYFVTDGTVTKTTTGVYPLSITVY